MEQSNINGVTGMNVTTDVNGLYQTAPEAKPIGSYPKSGIDVLIVGTGLAGLTAALECSRKGHNVRVLERNSHVNTAGDMYFMGLSGTHFFKHWPGMAEEYKKISLHNSWIETFKHDGEPMIKPMKVAVRLRAAGLNPDTPPGAFQMRPLVYKMFLEEVEKLGIQVETSKRVIDYFEDKENGRGYVITEDGQRYEADIIIAADGIGSKSQRLVGGQVRAKSSGRVMWRAAFPIEHLEKNPEVKEYFKIMPGDEPIVRTYLGPGTYALTLTRTDMIVWIINHDATGGEAESWENTISSDDVLAGMDKVPGPTKWAPIFKELVKLTPPNTIINYELLWRNPQPSWTSPGARVVQIGDSAHSYLPSSGNGATQAIEDAITLATCLQLGGRSKIPESVRAHVRIRFVRNACAQKIGFSNAQLLQNTKWEDVKIDPKQANPVHPRWIWKHNPEEYAYEVYEKVVKAMQEERPFEDDEQIIPPNYPPGYRYKPWDIEDIMRDLRAGKKVDLGGGDWS